jgi:hypothetical protein
MNNDKIQIFIINPLHIEFHNIPKFSKLIPKLNIFNEIIYDLCWCCHHNYIIKKYNEKNK